MKATLRPGTGHGSAILSGTTLITSEQGWFNFTDLSISHKGQYYIDFDIAEPTTVAGIYDFCILSYCFSNTIMP